MKQRAFPKDFLWGAATAAHQVEGGNHNQWSKWEKANAERLAREAHAFYGDAIWPDIANQATNPANYISGKAVDHYARYREDFALLKELNMNAFRFSIEWSRLEPKEGEWDEAAFAHYREYIHTLKTMGIAPVLTLWHWTVPVWFADKGAFARRRNLHYWDRFVTKVTQAFGADLAYIVTLNEPNGYTYLGYVNSKWPPLRNNALLGLWVINNLRLAHERAYRICKTICPDVPVGLAPTFTADIPIHSDVASKAVAALRSYVENWWLLYRVRRQLDFIGVNFYFTNHTDRLGRSRNPDSPRNDLNWYMEPRGVELVLEQLWQRFKKPLLITESGVADHADKWRKWWIEETLTAVRGAMAKGVEVRGYLHWSLLDNFEWADGWWPKFGLVAVDNKTMRRAIRPSAKWFASYIAQLDASETATVPKARAPKLRQQGRHRGK